MFPIEHFPALQTIVKLINLETTVDGKKHQWKFFLMQTEYIHQ